MLHNIAPTTQYCAACAKLTLLHNIIAQAAQYYFTCSRNIIAHAAQYCICGEIMSMLHNIVHAAHNNVTFKERENRLFRLVSR